MMIDKNICTEVHSTVVGDGWLLTERTAAMTKHMPLDDFRAVRIVLEEDDYAVSSGIPEPQPSDLIPDDTWRSITVLPDEVAVNTSNRHGTLLGILNQLAGTWPVCVGDSEHPDSVGLAMIEMINEPDASLYNMLVGFYGTAIKYGG
jgi:hypothetical protein